MAISRAQPPPEVEVRRSTRRRKTVSAFREKGRIVVAVPARLSAAQEAHWVEVMTRKVLASERRRKPGDEELTVRAEQLAEQYLPRAVSPTSVRWVSNQAQRWGSCTPAQGTIRISDRVRAMPSWVLDYLLLHELAHLLVPGHSADFWAILDRYPHTERAKGFLDGVTHAERAGLADAD